MLLDVPEGELKWWNKLVLKVPRSVDRTRRAVVRVGMDTFLEAETAGFQREKSGNETASQRVERVVR